MTAGDELGPYEILGLIGQAGSLRNPFPNVCVSGATRLPIPSMCQCAMASVSW
jgi:hypothetical protein